MDLSIRLFSSLMGFTLVVASAGCRTPPPETAHAPAPASETALAETLLKPGFVISVKVIAAGRDEILEPAKRVSDDGLIDLPLIGFQNAAGCTPGGLAGKLETAYRRYFVDPQVLVDIARDERPDAVSPWGSVTILGTVRSPGRIAIPPTRDLRVSGAIQRAGGFDTSARKNAIRVTRKKPDGDVLIREVDLDAVGHKGELEQDLILEPDDVIFVSERLF